MFLHQSKKYLVASVAILIATCGSAQAQYKERTLRIATTLSDQHPIGTGIKAMSACAVEKSGGKIKVQGVYNASLGGDIEASQSARAGTLDMLVTATSAMVGLQPKLGVFDLPFLFNTEEEAVKVLDGEFGKKISDLMPSTGLVNVSFWEGGFRNVTNSKHEIKTQADFAGIRLRVIQNNVFLDSFSALGANPVPMSWAEVFPALETKAIDGQENPLVTINDAQLYDVQGYLSLTRHTYTTYMVLYSKPLFDTLSPEEQTLVMECGKAGQAAELADVRKKVVSARESLASNGMKITEIEPAAIEEMRATLKPVYEKYQAAIGTDVVQSLQQSLAKTRGN